MSTHTTLISCATFALFLNLCSLAARADTMTLLVLIQFDKAADEGKLLESIRSISLRNCLVANALSLGLDHIIATIQCDCNFVRTPGSEAIERIGQLENVKQATTFSVLRP